jgi:protein-tyrosine phosphatase
MLTSYPALRPGRPGLSTILPALLVGEYPNPGDVAWLRETHGVTAVVNLQDDADLASKNLRLAAIETACRQAGVGFHRVPVTDGDVEMLVARLPGLVALVGGLVDAGHRVYLHCNAGFNRAPTVAIAYLHLRLGLPLEAAHTTVTRSRPCAPYVRALAVYRR